MLESLVLLALIPGNQVEVLGINSLIKPLKFALSIWIYSWTMAYLIPYLKNSKTAHRLVVFIVITMFFEQAVITVQASRGRLSHFNTDTALEATLFTLMGVMISLLTLYTLFVAIQFWRQKDELPRTKKEAIVLGLLIFIVASFMGGAMGSLMSHNVGGPMGEAGLQFANWSTKYGDLRVAHFIGIHALQLLPIFGFFLANTSTNEKSSLLIVRGVGVAYLAFVLGTFVQAMLGHPFIAI